MKPSILKAGAGIAVALAVLVSVGEALELKLVSDGHPSLLILDKPDASLQKFSQSGIYGVRIFNQSSFQINIASGEFLFKQNHPYQNIGAGQLTVKGSYDLTYSNANSYPVEKCPGWAFS